MCAMTAVTSRRLHDVGRSGWWQLVPLVPIIWLVKKGSADANEYGDEQQPMKPVTYSVIKVGLVGLTRYLATYWADRGVRANALSPGGVFNGQGEEFVHRSTSLIPLGRMASQEEYRAAVQFLCSDASAYLNGQNIVMDGRRSVW